MPRTTPPKGAPTPRSLSARLHQSARSHPVRTPLASVLVALIILMAGAFVLIRPEHGAGQTALPFTDPCEDVTEIRTFDVVALRTRIVYNNWGDHDDEGRLFVLASQVDALRAAVQANPFRPVDLVQPLVLRAHVGDCVRVNLRNDLPEPVGFHVHGALARPGQGMDVGRSGDDLTAPGQTRTYEFSFPAVVGMEGAHLVHSHGDARFLTMHGLFGAVVAEPPGTEWRSPSGGPLPAGAEAMILDPAGSDHREYVVIYHDEIEVRDRDGQELPIVSPYGEYGPGTKGINLRAEPFYHRFRLHDALFEQGDLVRPHDRSMAYSSYTYGDPGIFMPEAYVGDPTKFRLVNAGPGQHHVHHLHGGGTRWRVSPVSEDPQFDIGLTKQNPVVRSASTRVDVQNLGPGESFNAFIEGGAGGVQQAVGDLLYHCHVVEHYMAGMWSIWRVHNVRQDHLAELPDRAGGTPAAVNSLGLLGQQLPGGTVLTPANIRTWVEGQLPPRGVPADDDASVWDWSINERPEGPLYLGEPNEARSWANHQPAAPGQRPEILFNPDNGRIAVPLFQPHLGKRPPFAPGNGPAPYLGPTTDANHPDGLCPPSARQLKYNVVALATSIRYNSADEDPDGQIYVHAEDKAAVLSGSMPAKPLVLRANQGDCIDVTLTSQLLEESDMDGVHSKVNMHIHLVQFDPLGSDGLVSGFNYEQSIRPASVTGSTLGSAANAGASQIQVANGAPFKVGMVIGVGLTEPTVELRRVVEVNGNTLRLDAPLSSNHAQGERVGPEVVQYRWYADVELGMVYWHDHVNGLHSWRHGLFGGLVVEPAGSRWLDPKRSNPDPASNPDLRSGTVADVVTPQGNYREYVVLAQDNGGNHRAAAFNLRSAHFAIRDANTPLAGSAPTDLWEAYAGDPVRVRLLYAGQSESRGVGTFAVTGHRFPFEPHNPGSRLVDSVSFGVSDQHNLHLDCGAGGCARLAGDYLYYLTNPELLRGGGWGVFRVHGSQQSGLHPLPGHTPSPGALPQGPLRQYDIVAMRANVVLNQEANLRSDLDMFALASQENAIRSGQLRPEPLVLRALPGETVEIRLTNRMDRPVTLHAGHVLATMQDAGVPVGSNDASNILVQPGASKVARWFADKPGTGYLTSFSDPSNDALRGLYGALVVEPAGSSFEPATGPRSVLTMPEAVGNQTKVHEHVLFYQTSDPVFLNSIMPYRHSPVGLTLLNYRTEPLSARLGHNLQPEPAFDAHAYSSGPHGDPETPILQAEQGQRLLIRAVGAAGDQLITHAIAGHWWKADPDMAGSNLVSVATLGARSVSDAWIDFAGPGGVGDYLVGNHREGFAEHGQWGLLRVDERPRFEPSPTDDDEPVQPPPTDCGCPR
jgi:manganese oxidase